MGSHAMFFHLVARRTVVVAAAVFFVLGGPRPAWAQFELAGAWAPLSTEDVQNDSVPVDFLGLPLTEEGRLRALSYDESQKAMLERQCMHWGAPYMLLGPFGLSVVSEVEPVRGRAVSYTIAAWEDRMSTTIWMDGRPHPSPFDPHTQAGFTTGRWEGNTLVARTTHMKAAWIRKTGVPLSDEAEVHWRFYRHGAVLTVAMAVVDPSYLAEPYMVSKSFQVSPTPVATVTPCISTFEGREPGDPVPHFVPEKNPFADEFMKLYHLPREAALGYPETLYPEYRKRIKDAYQPPPPCKGNCGAVVPPQPR